MRLSREIESTITATAQRALAGECEVKVLSPSLSLARAMYAGANPVIERVGGNGDADRLRWYFPNGSVVKIVAA